MTKGNQTASGLPDDALQSWVSALVDGEEALSESTLEGLRRQDVQRERWETYHLIGDVMRTPDLALNPSAAFRGRLSAALAAEPAIVAAPLRRPVLQRKKLVSGLAVAAAVACVTWAAIPFLSSTDGLDPVASTVVASAGQASTAAAVDAAFTDYLEAHRQLSGSPGAYRMNVGWSSEGSRH